MKGKITFSKKKNFCLGLEHIRDKMVLFLNSEKIEKKEKEEIERNFLLSCELCQKKLLIS